MEGDGHLGCFRRLAADLEKLDCLPWDEEITPIAALDLHGVENMAVRRNRDVFAEEKHGAFAPVTLVTARDRRQRVRGSETAHVQQDHYRVRGPLFWINLVDIEGVLQQRALYFFGLRLFMMAVLG